MVDKTFYKLFAILFLTCAALVPMESLVAQPFPQREIFHLASWILDSSRDSITISFACAIPYNRIIFAKAENVPGSSVVHDVFEADLSFSIDASDSVTGIDHHRLSQSKIIANEFSITQDASHRAENIVTMTLPKSVYKISAEVRDDDQQISYMNTTETKRLNDSLSTFTSVFADSMNDSAMAPIIINDAARFPGPIIFALLTNDSTTRGLSLKLETLDGSIIKSDSLPPRKATFQPVDSNGNVSFQIVHSMDHSLYLGEFKVDTLDEGEYQIEADLNGKVDKIRFNYLWIDKPVSLRNFKTALSLLKYVAPDSVFSYLNSGNDKEQREKFGRNWKSRDPTPETAYNELEAEYYERADYAFEHFRTISVDDGTATDRGKAYILFGKPMSVKREFRSDGTYEIWYYPNHKKNLIFKEKGVGNFVLFQTENL